MTTAELTHLGAAQAIQRDADLRLAHFIHAGAGIEIVQFNPKVLVYEVYGPPGSSAEISYFDPDANVHSVSAALPWSVTLSTTLPTVSANLMARSDSERSSDHIGCRVTVNGTVREEQSADGVNAQTYCLVKSA